MEGNNGRNGRRNDSISSIMSFSAENNNNNEDDTSRTRDNNNSNTATATATPRDTQRSSRALNQRDSNHVLSGDTVDSNFMDTSSEADTDQSNDTMSDSDIRHVLFEMLDMMPETAAVDLVTPYQKAALLPPVTQMSLAELDVSRIINNPKLRHDVNFDRELHFRPNLDGSRGKQKLKSADEYWEALLAELELYRAIGFRLMRSRCAEEMEYWSVMMEANQIRLPGIFSTIHEVLKTLIPDRDQAMVAENLDVAMIMQQIAKGMFSLMNLAQWLATILKAHCAPMRDDWIDEMVEQIRIGSEKGDQKAIVLGLRQTLAILEAMKLDVANHQIRNLRSLLIDDTVNFQQKYHLHKINSGRMDVSRARIWFKREENYLRDCNLSPSPLEIFTSALFRSLMAKSSVSQFPETFHLDAERLRTIRSDIHHTIQLNMCFEAFDILARGRLDDNTRKSAKKELEARILDIIGESRLYLANIENVAAEIVRIVLQFEKADTTYDSDLVAIVVHQLRTDLPLSSISFGAQLQDIFEAQFPRLCNAVKSSSRLPVLSLHDAMLPQIQTSGKGPVKPTSNVLEPPINEILKRIAHLAVLHWHIWSPIVYDVTTEQSFSRPDSSGNNNSGAPQLTSNPATSTSISSTPEVQNQGNSFTQSSGPSVVNGGSQK